MGFCLKVLDVFFFFGFKILDECGILFDIVIKRIIFIVDVFILEV